MHDLLKVLACGSVDDGKSTLLGRMMYDSGALFSDQKTVLEKESSAIYGTSEPDYSLLLDGLEAEREQRITIDVAYRFFSTGKRSFIVADAPGHDEYTRNMAVGASFADIAVILVDASKGVLPQTKRHFSICRLMGLTDMIFAVNKMDLVGYDRTVFDSICSSLRALAEDGGLKNVFYIPLSAAKGENVTKKSKKTPWYDGPPLLEYLETVKPEKRTESGFIMPVQRVSAMTGGLRGYQGCAECGTVSKGDTVTVYPSGVTSTVSSLLVSGAAAEKAETGSQLTVFLSDSVDVSRGCVICRETVPSLSTRFSARILWVDDAPLTSGKSMFMKLGTVHAPVTVTLSDTSKNAVKKNDITDCTVSVSMQIAVDAFDAHRCLGEFILIDRVTHSTSAWGKVLKPFDNNYIWRADSEITEADRAKLKGQTPFVLWFTGLPGSGKTAVANEVEKRLFAEGRHTMLLDGDSLRAGINASLGFSDRDRSENIRIAAEIAKLMTEAGLIVLVSLVSPGRADRENAKKIIGNVFYEIYVSASVGTCEKRDPKGYYAKAREGRIKNFTGITGGYEPPVAPSLVLDSENKSVAECADEVMRLVSRIAGK